MLRVYLFFFNDTATTEIYTLSLHDALPISGRSDFPNAPRSPLRQGGYVSRSAATGGESGRAVNIDRKSTRLNSSHANISYDGFCLEKKKKHLRMAVHALNHILTQP